MLGVLDVCTGEPEVRNDSAFQLNSERMGDHAEVGMVIGEEVH